MENEIIFLHSYEQSFIYLQAMHQNENIVVFLLVTYTYDQIFIILGNFVYIWSRLFHNTIAAGLRGVHQRGVRQRGGVHHPSLLLLIPGNRKTWRCPAAPDCQQKAARTITIFMTYTFCSMGDFRRPHFVVEWRRDFLTPYRTMYSRRQDKTVIMTWCLCQYSTTVCWSATPLLAEHWAPLGSTDTVAHRGSHTAPLARNGWLNRQADRDVQTISGVLYIYTFLTLRNFSNYSVAQSAKFNVAYGSHRL